MFQPLQQHRISGQTWKKLQLAVCSNAKAAFFMGVVKLGKRWAGIVCRALASMALLYAPTLQTAEIGFLLQMAILV